MAAAKTCRAGHKGCKCVLMCCQITDETGARIKASVAAGRGRSMFSGGPNRLVGPMCRCGVRRKPSGTSLHAADSGLCTVHPDKPPQPFVRGAGGNA